MFTIIIAEKEHIDKIEQYDLFLKPFREESGVDVITLVWHPEETELSKMVPDLIETVAKHPVWRAVVVKDKDGIELANPFNTVSFKETHIEEIMAECSAEESDDEAELWRKLLAKEKNKKTKALEEASGKDFVRLMTFLCELPYDAANEDEPAVQLDENRSNIIEYKEYLQRKDYFEFARRKHALRTEILKQKGKNTRFAYPEEVLCVALRTHETESSDLVYAWSAHVTHDYSRFYDWNMYFDRMRYLVFDILPEGHTNYIGDYIRFLCLIMVLASQRLPANAINSHKVYLLNCETDKDVLGRELATYKHKLTLTYGKIEHLIQDIKNKVPELAKDQEVNSVLSQDVPVHVVMDGDIEISDLFPKHPTYLTTDMLKTESAAWVKSYASIQKTLHRVLQQPPRALFSATSSMRTRIGIEAENCRFYNEFQLGDVWNRIYDEEKAMFETDTSAFCNVSEYREKMEKAKAKVDDALEKRIDKSKALLIGLSGLILLFVSFLPLVFTNFGDLRSRSYAVAIMLSSIVVFCAACVGALVWLKYKMRKDFKSFNDVMHGIYDEISTGMKQASAYLGHICNVMKGYSIINYGEEHISEDNLLIGIYRKHQSDISNQIAILEKDCQGLFPDDVDVRIIDVDPYDYLFERPETYEYPIPYSKIHKSIVFIQEESSISVPVDFINGITAKMEEQYD